MFCDNSNNDWLYINSPNNLRRYIIGEKGKNPLVCIGINPSTATPEKLDNTMRVVKSRALSLGYDGWLMINLYSQRSTNPNNLHVNIHLDDHKTNMEVIKKYILPLNCDIWVAWGTLIQKRKYLKRCLKDIVYQLGENKDFITIGNKSIAGHPHHPLYLNNNLKPEIFDMDKYIKSIIS